MTAVDVAVWLAVAGSLAGVVVVGRMLSEWADEVFEAAQGLADWSAELAEREALLDGIDAAEQDRVRRVAAAEQLLARAGLGGLPSDCGCGFGWSCRHTRGGGS